jgi:hypothetical protein
MTVELKTKKIIAREVLILLVNILVPVGIYLAHQAVNLFRGYDIYLQDDILVVCYETAGIIFLIIYPIRGLFLLVRWAIKTLRKD